MPSQLKVIQQQGAVPVPFEYDLSSAETFQIVSATGTFNGAAASGAFLPCLSLYASNGALLARVFPGTVAAGDTAEVTYGPFLQVPSSFTPGSGSVQYIRTLGAGTWTPPSGASIATVVCVGAAGGGSGGGTATGGANQGGGGGGGGGAVRVVTYDLAALAVVYPAGVPYVVGTGGGGGAGRPGGNGLGSPGVDGGLTSFGTQVAGGGGGGLATGSSGGGGAATSAVGGNGGSPVSGTGGIDIQGTNGLANSSGFPGVWGGGSGGGSHASAGVNDDGYPGGTSMYAGPGGGGGAGVSPAAWAGAKGGVTLTYLNSSSAIHGNGTASAGTYLGPFTGSGGDGGDSAFIAGAGTTAGAKGKAGSFGAGGGGGGAACTGGAGNPTGGDGGSGGNGQIIVFLG